MAGCARPARAAAAGRWAGRQAPTIGHCQVEQMLFGRKISWQAAMPGCRSAKAGQCADLAPRERLPGQHHPHRPRHHHPAGHWLACLAQTPWWPAAPCWHCQPPAPAAQRSRWLHATMQAPAPRAAALPPAAACCKQASRWVEKVRGGHVRGSLKHQ